MLAVQELSGKSGEDAGSPARPITMGEVAGASVVQPQAGLPPGGVSGSDNSLGTRGTVGLAVGLATLLAAVVAILALCGRKKATNSNLRSVGNKVSVNVAHVYTAGSVFVRRVV